MSIDRHDRRGMLRWIGTVGTAALGASFAGCSAPGSSGGATPTAASTDPPPTTGASEPPPVRVASTPSFGDLLVDADGNTLYMFEPDGQGPSTCYDDCAAAWPPLLVETEDALAGGEGVGADLGTVERDDGSLQVTADGWPLYYFAGDEAAGDVNGQGIGNVWWVLRPDGSVARSTVSATEHETLGNVLTDAAGNVLYMFAPDEMGASTCYEDCAAAWPPLTVQSADALLPAATTSADLGTVERDDGTLQVTAGGWPLYYFANDEEPGQARGQEVLNVWFVLRPDGSPLRPTVSTREIAELGEVLTDGAGMTLYMFEPDEQGASTCTGECIEAWPPLTVESEDAIVRSVRADASLGTVERDDGTLQVTAADWPLYYYDGDEARGDVNGQGVGDVWWVLRPDGTAVRQTVGTPTPMPTPVDVDSGGGGGGDGGY